VLDIGCGTGSALKEIQEQSTGSAYAFGIDLSLGMCRQAAKKMRKMGSESTLITQGNALRLPFRTAAFDSILLSFTLETFAGSAWFISWMQLSGIRYTNSINGHTDGSQKWWTAVRLKPQQFCRTLVFKSKRPNSIRCTVSR
jgi:SAM-dependent methyltransferase